MSGKLFLCATPIGNLEDVTFRVLETLKTVDLIAAEDTRHSIKLLNHFEIKTPMTSYHEYNKFDKAEYLVRLMKEGQNVALISDAGTPGISDPGEELVRLSLESGVEVTSIPGPAAVITALTMSGQVTRRFCFEGFLPTDKKERVHILERLETEERTTVIYEAPHRLIKTLELLSAVLGNRRISFCKELTKRYESMLTMIASEALDYYRAHEPKGEYVLVIEGADGQELKRQQQADWERMDILDHLKLYENEGVLRKEAMKLVAADRGITKRDVYQYCLEHKNDD